LRNPHELEAVKYEILQIFAEPLEDVQGTQGFWGTPVEKHYFRSLRFVMFETVKKFSTVEIALLKLTRIIKTMLR
jgi:hypothetical protein